MTPKPAGAVLVAGLCILVTVDPTSFNIPPGVVYPLASHSLLSFTYYVHKMPAYILPNPMFIKDATATYVLSRASAALLAFALEDSSANSRFRIFSRASRSSLFNEAFSVAIP